MPRNSNKILLILVEVKIALCTIDIANAKVLKTLLNQCNENIFCTRLKKEENETVRYILFLEQQITKKINRIQRL